MMLGFQQLAASVKAAAPACLGRVLRFHKRRDLESRFLADLPWNHQQVVDGILASFCKEAASYVDSSVQHAAAEAIYVSVHQGHGRISALLAASLKQRALQSTEPHTRVAGVHALAHVVEGVPALEGAWRALASHLADPDEAVCRTASGHFGGRAPLVCSNSGIVVPLLQQLLCEGGKDGKQLQQHSRACVVETAACIASSGDSFSGPTRDSLAAVAMLALKDEAVEVRIPAFQLLQNLGSPEPAGARDALLDQLHDNGLSCLSACHALTSMVQPGDAAVVSRVSKLLCVFQGTPPERAEIAGCLRHLARIGGDRTATDAFLRLLQDYSDDSSCRVAALGGLESVAFAGDSGVRTQLLELVSSCPPDTDPQTLIAAVATLKKVCHIGDMEVAAVLVDLLVADTSATKPTLLTEIVGALVELCAPGDPAILAQIAKRLSSGSWPVRHAVLKAIRALALPNEVLPAVQVCLRDPHPDVRECAVETLAAVCQPGDRQALAALESLLEEDQPLHVEITIQEALETLSGDMVNSSVGVAPALTVPPRRLAETTSMGSSFQLVDSASMCSMPTMAAATNQSSFQMADGASQCSVPVRQASNRSESSFELVDAVVSAA